MRIRAFCPSGMNMGRETRSMQFADRDAMSAVLHGKKPPLSHYNDFKAVSYMLCRLFSFSAPVQVPPSMRVQRAGLSASLYQSQVVRESRR